MIHVNSRFQNIADCGIICLLCRRKMPCCCAINCSARSERNVRLFLLPRGVKNKERRQLWINNIKRKNLPGRAYVCEKHFTENQFENRRADNKRPLRWNAVPTLFSYTINRKQYRKEPAFTTINVPKSSEETDIRDTMNENFLDEHDYSMSTEEEANPKIVELQRKLQLWQKKLKQLSEETDALMEQIQSVFDEVITNQDLPYDNSTEEVIDVPTTSA